VFVSSLFCFYVIFSAKVQKRNQTGNKLPEKRIDFVMVMQILNGFYEM